MSKIIIFLIFLSLIFYIFSNTENILLENFSKYEKNDYIKFFKISDSLILSTKQEQTNNNFFKKLINFISLSEAHITESYTYIFKDKINFNRILLPNTEEQCNQIKDKIKIFYKLDSEEIELIEDFTFKELPNKNIIILKNEIKSNLIKINIKIPEICQKKINKEEIIFLSSETKIFNENIINVFDKKDYRMLTISKEYNKKEFITNLENESKKYKLSDYADFYINRIKSVYTGAISYDPKREFTTNKSGGGESNILYQRGDVEQYASNTLKMVFPSTNRQSTGIYGRSNETITVFVKKGNTKDPLPSLRVMQHLGHWRNWLGKINNLKEGEQTITIDDFKITEDYTLQTIPGGPIYLINPYTTQQQSQNLTVYIEGGELFPIFRLGDDEEEYKTMIKECVDLNKKDKTKYFDITELVGLRETMTMKATDAYKQYISLKISPEENLRNWESYLKKLYTYDGIQFDKNLPYYDEKNNYLNINIRHMQIGGYGFTEHIGISGQDWIDRALNINEEDIGWGYPFVIGQMLDINERIISSTTNNMISKFSETFLQNDGTWGTDMQEYKILYLTPDNIDPLLRGCKSDDKKTCKGFLTNLPLNYLIFWDLESLYHGYWGKINNMYRYENTVSNKLTKEEKFVYFSNIILGFDLGYYFTRWGLSFSNGESIFDESKTSSEYKSLMQKAINDNKIDTKTKKKYWYVDLKEYNYINNIGLGCYQDKDEYDIQISQITSPSKNKYILSFPKVKCPGHLGFEIYENNNLIGFTYEYTYTDETVYENGYNPKYKIIAYDRLLDTSNESEIKSFTSKLALKQINLNNPLKEEE